MLRRRQLTRPEIFMGTHSTRRLGLCRQDPDTGPRLVATRPVRRCAKVLVKRNVQASEFIFQLQSMTSSTFFGFLFNAGHRHRKCGGVQVEVAWTGKFAAAMPLKGVEITWAHAPEEIRVLTSPDGSNFEEAICFRPTGKVFLRWMACRYARFRKAVRRNCCMLLF